MNKFSFIINDRAYDVSVEMKDEKSACVCVNGEEYQVSMKKEEENLSSETDNIQKDSCIKTSIVPKGSFTITSPIPGILVSLHASIGDKVKKGQLVAVVEAMKMENDILAEQDGTVTSVLASVGDSLMEGTSILEINN